MNAIKLSMCLFSFKCLVGYGTPLDGLILLILTGLFVFLFHYNHVVETKLEIEKLKLELNDRIQKLESITGQLSVSNGFKRV